MESRLVKSIFLKNPPVHDNIFFESWFNFDCESDGIIGIPKFTFLESIGTKFESNHLVWGWHTSLWCMPLTMNQIRKCDVSSSFLIDYQRKSENHKIRKNDNFLGWTYDNLVKAFLAALNNFDLEFIGRSHLYFFIVVISIQKPDYFSNYSFPQILFFGMTHPPHHHLTIEVKMSHSFYFLRCGIFEDYFNSCVWKTWNGHVRPSLVLAGIETRFFRLVGK